jgi:hypothetical protein
MAKQTESQSPAMTNLGHSFPQLSPLRSIDHGSSRSFGYRLLAIGYALCAVMRTALDNRSHPEQLVIP